MRFCSETQFTLGATVHDWLLGLSRLSWSDDRAALGWRFALPLWVWVAIVLAALALASWSYTRLMGRPSLRVACATVRALLFILIAVLIAGPTLTVAQEEVEPDNLLLLVDRSSSLQIRDAVDDETGALVSRDQSLRTAIAKHADLFSSAQLGRDRRLVWLGFGTDTFELDAPHKNPEALTPADISATAIRTAIDQALQRVAGRPISGIVLFSDGRSPQSTGIDLVRRVQQQAIGVYSIPLGATVTPLDLAIGRVDAPDKALVNDIVPVTVLLERYPSDAQVDLTRVRVRLIDAQTNRTLDEQTPQAGVFDRQRPVYLNGRAAVAGPVTWRVELLYEDMPDAVDPLHDRERITDNNVHQISLELIDRPIRVLYVEAYPRWEYRYLKNLLVREQSIQSSVLLISADSSFAQEGGVPINRLPNSSEELDRYDVVMIGDVRSSHFSVQQIEMLRDHVSERGAGLIWIGGSTGMPRTYEATSLSDLLPMSRPGLVKRSDLSWGPAKMTPAPLATVLHVLQLRSERGSLSSGADGLRWPGQLPPLLWTQDMGKLKPTAEVLAFAPLEGGRRLLPLVVRLRYGAGQTVYVATDETWRWRLGRGDLFFDQFWMQLVQMLARGRLQQGPERMWLDVSHRRIEHDQALIVTLRIDNQQLLERRLPSIAVAITDAADPERTILDRIELLPVSVSGSKRHGGIEEGEGFIGQAAGGVREYQAIWRPSASSPQARTSSAARSRTLVLRVVEPALVDQDITEQVELVAPGDELRHPAADHERLVQLSAQTGGEVVPLAELPRLSTLIPNRARRKPNDISEPLWDSPLGLVVVVFLLSVEWIGRKVMRLA